MATFLCLDSALGAGSAAIYNDGELLEFRPIAEKGSQAKLLVSTIEECLAARSLKPEQLSAIYCTIGPGGFTGIRIALSAAQALSMTLGIPLMSVSTLACIAVEACSERNADTRSESVDKPALSASAETSEKQQNCFSSSRRSASGESQKAFTQTNNYMTPILPASRGNVYMQSFEVQTLKPQNNAAMVGLDDLTLDMNLVKLSAPEIRGLEIESATISSIDARSIGKLVSHESFTAYHQLPADPLYIRPPDAKLPSKKV